MPTIIMLAGGVERLGKVSSYAPPAFVLPSRWLGVDNSVLFFLGVLVVLLLRSLIKESARVEFPSMQSASSVVAPYERVRTLRVYDWEIDGE